MEATLDRRTAIEEAFDSAEADAKGEEYTPPVREPVETKDTTEVTEKDPAEIEAEALDQPKPKERQRTKGVPLDQRVKPADKTSLETSSDQVKPTSALDKAPISWGAKRNEVWAKVPAEARAIINKREAEIQQGMSQAGRIKQIAEEYHQVVMPFENVIRSMNTTPREAITNVMQTATALIIGTQAQKCAILTEMVQRYGVDVAEFDKTLTAALKGGGQRPANVQSNNEGQLDPRILKSLQPLFSLQQRLEQAEGRNHEKLQQEAVEAINSVENEAYFEDVRDDMADIMEISAKRGHIMTIKQAYDKACQIHPEIGKLVGTPARRTPSDALARARRASSTVRGAPGGPVGNKANDRRAQIEEAWNSVG
jgi:hypothetical protein